MTVSAPAEVFVLEENLSSAEFSFFLFVRAPKTDSLFLHDRAYEVKDLRSTVFVVLFQKKVYLCLSSIQGRETYFVILTFDTVTAHQQVLKHSFFSNFSSAFDSVHLRWIFFGLYFCRLQLDPDKCFLADRFFSQLFQFLIFISIINII